MKCFNEHSWMAKYIVKRWYRKTERKGETQSYVYIRGFVFMYKTMKMKMKKQIACKSTNIQKQTSFDAIFGANHRRTQHKIVRILPKTDFLKWKIVDLMVLPLHTSLKQWNNRKIVVFFSLYHLLFDFFLFRFIRSYLLSGTFIYKQMDEIKAICLNDHFWKRKRNESDADELWIDAEEWEKRNTKQPKFPKKKKNLKSCAHDGCATFAVWSLFVFDYCISKIGK